MANEKQYLLPDLGEGLTEGTIANWLVAVGDTVETDQPVAEIETAKAVVEVPSPFEGSVTRLHAEEGDEVEVGQPLVTIDLDGGGAGPTDEAAPEDAAGGVKEAPTGSSPQDAEVAEMVPSPADRVAKGDRGDDGDSGSVLVGYGTGGKARSRRRRAAGGPAGPGPAGSAPGASGPPTGAPPGRPLAKPPVRKLAKDLGIDLADVPGSGPDGIITRDDVQAFFDARPSAAPSAPPPAPAGDGAAAGAREREAAPRPDLVERIPLKGVRKVVAQQMTVSRREIPEATTWVDCDATGLWELRQQLNGSQDHVKVSPLAIIMRACVAGLREYPEVNARLDTETDEIVLHRFVNLGFAAQTDRGLVVPVIKGADRMSTLGIAQELNRLAELARDAKLAPEDMQGGTFTLSNYGSFGVDGGSAVINHPEAAILGVGRISDRPWVHEGRIQPRKVMQLSIAFDHRICDGGEAASFLRFVADCVESPTTLLAAL